MLLTIGGNEVEYTDTSKVEDYIEDKENKLKSLSENTTDQTHFTVMYPAFNKNFPVYRSAVFNNMLRMSKVGHLLEEKIGKHNTYFLEQIYCPYNISTYLSKQFNVPFNDIDFEDYSNPARASQDQILDINKRSYSFYTAIKEIFELEKLLSPHAQKLERIYNAMASKL